MTRDKLLAELNDAARRQLRDVFLAHACFAAGCKRLQINGDTSKLVTLADAIKAPDSMLEAELRRGCCSIMRQRAGEQLHAEVASDSLQVARVVPRGLRGDGRHTMSVCRVRLASPQRGADLAVLAYRAARAVLHPAITTQTLNVLVRGCCNRAGQQQRFCYDDALNNVPDEV